MDNDKFDTLILQGGFNSDTPKTIEQESPFGKITHYFYRLSYGFPVEPQWFWWWDILDAHYKQSDPFLLKVYNEIRELCKTHKILLHGQGDMMHPDFISTLSKRWGRKEGIYTVFSIDGEPASSKILSHPVVKAYDFATTCGLSYDDFGNTCSGKLIENGAYGSSWIPVGTKYPKTHTAWDYPIEGERDIDIIFLGPPRYRDDETSKYPPNKYTACKYIKDNGINIHYEPWQNIEYAESLYKRAKIGINFHGPSPFGVGSAQRLWDLAVCGVMPITDGREYGIEKIFLPSKECSAFSYKNLDEAVNQIRYFLNHEDERIKIAKNARERTYQEYRNDEDQHYYFRIINKAIEFWKQKGIWK